MASLAMVCTVAGATTMTSALPRQLNMFDGILGIGVESVGDHRAVCQAAEGQRGNELRCPVGHDGVDQRARLGQLAGQIQRLVAGNAAGYAQYNPLAAQHAATPFGLVRVPVQIVDMAQPDERQVGVDVVENARFAGYDVGQAASGDDGGKAAQLILDATGKALDQLGVAQHQPGLQGRRRILADGRRRGREFDAPQLRGVQDRASAATLMPGAMAPPRYTPSDEMTSNTVAVPKSTMMVG